MKNILLIVLLIATGFAYGQKDEDKVPQEVLSAFNGLYPNINSSDIDWDREKGRYEANFKEEGKRTKACFDNQGNWISSEMRDVTLQELPSNVIDALFFSDYSDWKTDDITVTSNHADIYYEIEVKKGRKDKKIYFDQFGNRTEKENI